MMAVQLEYDVLAIYTIVFAHLSETFTKTGKIMIFINVYVLHNSMLSHSSPAKHWKKTPVVFSTALHSNYLHKRLYFYQLYFNIKQMTFIGTILVCK